ncbi:hypothetical protein D3C85_1817250 [compost metagenome]
MANSPFKKDAVTLYGSAAAMQGYVGFFALGLGNTLTSAGLLRLIGARAGLAFSPVGADDTPLCRASLPASFASFVSLR